MNTEQELGELCRELGTMIRLARIGSGYETQKPFAKAMGISVALLSQIESSGRKGKRWDYIPSTKLAKALDLRFGFTDGRITKLRNVIHRRKIEKQSEWKPGMKSAGCHTEEQRALILENTMSLYHVPEGDRAMIRIRLGEVLSEFFKNRGLTLHTHP